MSGFEIMPMLAAAGSTAMEGLSGIGSLLATTGNYAAGIPMLLQGMMGGGAAATPAAASSAVPTFGYSSMASSLAPSYSIAPGMLEQTMGGLAVPPPVPPLAQPPSPGQTSPLGSAGGAAWDVYKFMRSQAAQDVSARKPFSHAPNIHTGAAVPVKVGQPLVVKSPLERYAMMLRRS